MKQYCKYCANACMHGDSHCWCHEKEKIISETAAAKPNKCKSFDFCEIDVFMPGRIYKERKTKVNDGEQIKIQMR